MDFTKQPPNHATKPQGLFFPKDGTLFPVQLPPPVYGREPSSTDIGNSAAIGIAKNVHQSMEKLIRSQKYPCIAATSSFQKNEYLLGLYEGFGLGSSAARLSSELGYYLDELSKSKSLYFTFWAVFPELENITESEFEKKLWSELSHLSSADPLNLPWDPNFSSNPSDRNFCFSFRGQAFFVVGLHANSSRLGRKFAFPALVFNALSQFNQLIDEGKYLPMVKVNRLKDIEFSGDINPMVEAYGDDWEAIQFSGSNNSPDWKCPFKHISNEALNTEV